MKLILEWRSAPKMWSVRLGVVAALLYGLQPVLPHWEGVIPEWAYASLASLVAIAGVVARLIPQQPIEQERKRRQPNV
ncbi:DUF7940 domain-containing protein [Vreelandella titanicae]|uniref:DUF7940 domain-containing protein n=1 Tax=Vreelandella titanicae TaxID=664683 RepID=UPI00382ACF59